MTRTFSTLLAATLCVACGSGEPPAPRVACDWLQPADLAAACGTPFEDASERGGKSTCIRTYKASASGVEASLDVSVWRKDGFGSDPGDITVSENRDIDLGRPARVRTWSLGSQPKSISGYLIQDGVRVVIGTDADTCSMDRMEQLVRLASERLTR